MISAWFMQNRETISISKWLNLYVKVVIVFLMCLLIARSLGENISARTLLEAILSPLNSSYWYCNGLYGVDVICALVEPDN